MIAVEAAVTETRMVSMLETLISELALALAIVVVVVEVAVVIAIAAWTVRARGRERAAVVVAFRANAARERWPFARAVCVRADNACHSQNKREKDHIRAASNARVSYDIENK